MDHTQGFSLNSDSKGKEIQMSQKLTIGRLSKTSGVTIDSIRFYERRGLLDEPQRTESNYRVYPDEAAARLRFLKKAQSLGFTLDEIKGLLSLHDNPQASRAEVKARTEQKITLIRSRIADLSRMLGVLEEMNEACDGEGLIAGCPILAALGEDDCPECHP